ncbi:MAG: transglutaminase-like domain-containing protein [candidate division WOR-3 bacterium]
MRRIFLLTFLLIACFGGNADKGERVSEKAKNYDFHFIGSVYMMGNRAGWEEIKVYKTSNGYDFNEEMYIKVLMLGLVKEMTTKINADLNENGGVRVLNFVLSTQDQNITAEGRIENGKFVVEYKPPTGSPQSFVYNAHKPVLTPQTFVFAAAKGLLKEGKYHYFDPSVAAFMESDVEKEGDTLWILNAKGILVRAHVRDGKLLLQNQPLKMDIVAQPEEEAKAPVEPFNVLSLYAVRPKGNIGDVKTLTFLKVKIYPIRGDLNPNFANQRVAEARGDTALVNVEYPKELRGSTSPPPTQLSHYLEPTQFLEVNDPEIQSLAKEITKGAKTDLEKAKRIFEWVYNNLEKRGSITIPTAKQVLRERYGDCNEHATLYAALARAAGIPTEIMVGLIYQGDGFYYHAWNASWIGGQWVPIDPVYGEFPARPYRITLQQGSLEKQATIMSVIGFLNIEILEARHE